MRIVQRSPVVAACFLAALGILFVAPRVAAQGADKNEQATFDSAVWLLERSTLVHRDGLHSVLLRALRQMKDPQLKPLYDELINRRHPVLRIHGMLGISEVNDKHELDLKLLATIDDAPTQAQIVSSAIDSDLLTTEQAAQILQWTNADPALTAIVAAKLVADKSLKDPAVLDKLLAAENLGVRSMGALLKLQLGHAEAMQTLKALNLSDASERDSVRLLILQAMMRYEFDAGAPWAMQIVNEPGAPAGLAFLALRAAMRFHAPGSSAAWQQRFTSSTSEADRVRLAMLALDLAKHLEPELFDVLKADNDDSAELINAAAVTGRLLAQDRPAVDSIVALLKLNHPLANKWVVAAGIDLPAEQARPVLVEIIKAAEGGDNPPRLRDQRLEHAIIATQTLIEKHPDGPSLVASLFDQSPKLTTEALLVGLIRADMKYNAHQVIAGRETWPSRSAEALALLLRARHGVKLSDAQMQELALIVRGGAGLQEFLRIQAAWVYLKNKNQQAAALARALKRE